MSDNTQPFTPGGAPAARAAVERLKAYSAPLEGRRQMLRLDFNENTIGPSPLVAQALRNFSTEEIAVIRSTTACGTRCCRTCWKPAAGLD